MRQHLNLIEGKRQREQCQSEGCRLKRKENIFKCQYTKMVLNWQALTVTLKMGKSECKVLKITVHAFGFQSFAGRKNKQTFKCAYARTMF